MTFTDKYINEDKFHRFITNDTVYLVKLLIPHLSEKMLLSAYTILCIQAGEYQVKNAVSELREVNREKIKFVQDTYLLKFKTLPQIVEDPPPINPVIAWLKL